MAHPRPQVGYVLQSQGDGLPVKFGVAANVRSRIAAFKTHNPTPVDLLAIVGGGARHETDVKRLFAANLLSGEWYAPCAEMNDYLSALKEDGRLLKQARVDHEYLLTRIVPVIKAYLGDRAPNDNTLGDLVYRVLHNGLPLASPRLNGLIEATKGAVTAEMVLGFAPDRSDEAFVRIRLDATEARPSQVVPFLLGASRRKKAA